ncbi:MAG TPA: NADH-quinone oxidoreductase subunit C [Ktedonobacterales bacterium]|nr:NADH-quinone oxidoreductase subunit C [Ktedonobacterales bacterium]
MDLSVRPGAQPQRPERSAEAPSAPSLLAYDRDHLNALLSQLAPLEQRLGLGASLPKSRLPQGVIGVEVPSDKLLDFARLLRDEAGFEMLTCVTAVDMVDHLQSLYHFRSLAHNWLLQVRVRLTAAHPEVDSLVSLYPSANWLEREQYDLLGVVYRGHPDLRRILLEDEFAGHPLLKSFASTPIVRHDPATTQVPGVRAVSGEQVRHQERIQNKRLGQGSLERIHPGMTTFGGAAVYLETGQGVVTPDEARQEQERQETREPARYLSTPPSKEEVPPSPQQPATSPGTPPPPPPPGPPSPSRLGESSGQGQSSH